GVAADVSSRELRLPARTCTFDPTPILLLTRPFSVTRSERCWLAPLFRHSVVAPAPPVTISVCPSPFRSPRTSPRGEEGSGPPLPAAIATAVTSLQLRPRLRKTCGPSVDHVSRSRRPSLS